MPPRSLDARVLPVSTDGVKAHLRDGEQVDAGLTDEFSLDRVAGALVLVPAERATTPNRDAKLRDGFMAVSDSSRSVRRLHGLRRNQEAGVASAVFRGQVEDQVDVSDELAEVLHDIDG